jgi:plasmid stability protein
VGASDSPATTAQFLVCNIESSVKASLQRRARRNGRSMEEETRDILRVALNDDKVPSNGLIRNLQLVYQSWPRF